MAAEVLSSLISKKLVRGDTPFYPIDVRSPKVIVDSSQAIVCDSSDADEDDDHDTEQFHIKSYCCSASPQIKDDAQAMGLHLSSIKSTCISPPAAQSAPTQSAPFKQPQELVDAHAHQSEDHAHQSHQPYELQQPNSPRAKRQKLDTLSTSAFPLSASALASSTELEHTDEQKVPSTPLYRQDSKGFAVPVVPDPFEHMHMASSEAPRMDEKHGKDTDVKVKLLLTVQDVKAMSIKRTKEVIKYLQWKTEHNMMMVPNYVVRLAHYAEKNVSFLLNEQLERNFNFTGSFRHKRKQNGDLKFHHLYKSNRDRDIHLVLPRYDATNTRFDWSAFLEVREFRLKYGITTQEGRGVWTTRAMARGSIIPIFGLLGYDVASKELGERKHSRYVLELPTMKDAGRNRGNNNDNVCWIKFNGEAGTYMSKFVTTAPHLDHWNLFIGGHARQPLSYQKQKANCVLSKVETCTFLLSNHPPEYQTIFVPVLVLAEDVDAGTELLWCHPSKLVHDFETRQRVGKNVPTTTRRNYESADAEIRLDLCQQEVLRSLLPFFIDASGCSSFYNFRAVSSLSPSSTLSSSSSSSSSLSSSTLL